MKQTAVEWLYHQIVIKNSDVLKFRQYLEKAKEMEKKQLFLAANTSAKQAYKAGQKSMYCGCYEIDGCTNYEEWLYDKTFKSE